VERGETTLVGIKYFILNLIIAGSITTSTSIYGFINLIIHKRNIQKRLQQEVNEVIGQRQVSLKDRESMPYTMATILELLRYTSVLPFGTFAMTTRDTTIYGKHVPANTDIYFNFYGLNHDEKNFPNPYNFNPERFLDADGKLVAPDHPNRKNMSAFGSGMRACLGESLAKARLFLVIVAMLQKFDILDDDTEPLVTADPRLFPFDVILANPPYQARFIER